MGSKSGDLEKEFIMEQQFCKDVINLPGARSVVASDFLRPVPSLQTLCLPPEVGEKMGQGLFFGLPIYKGFEMLAVISPSILEKSSSISKIIINLFSLSIPKLPTPLHSPYFFTIPVGFSCFSNGWNRGVPSMIEKKIVEKGGYAYQA